MYVDLSCYRDGQRRSRLTKWQFSAKSHRPLRNFLEIQSIYPSNFFKKKKTGNYSVKLLCLNYKIT